MISFFRKIRQQLLQENRVTRYLAYAVGEILLVVIGILIALQVNNWNEVRKTETTQKALLVSFLEDLRADASAIKTHLNDFDRILEVHRDLYLLRKEKLVLSELKNPELLRGSIRYHSIVMMNNPDFGSKVRNPEIKNEVLLYYQTLSRVKNSYEQYDQVVKEVVRPYMREQILLNEDFYLNEKEPKNEIPSMNLEKLSKAVKGDDFSQILIEANLKAVELKTNFERILEANEQLNKKISEHISENQ